MTNAYPLISENPTKSAVGGWERGVRQIHYPAVRVSYNMCNGRLIQRNPIFMLIVDSQFLV